MHSNNDNDLLKNMEENRFRFSKGHKKIADFLLNNYDEAIYLTASELSAKIGISESTIVRFAMMLGFKGYPELQEELIYMARKNLIASKRLEVATTRLGKTNQHLLKAVMQSDSDRILRSLEDIDEGIFELVVDNIINARNIYIIGGRSSASLATFLAFHLNLMKENVKSIDFNSGTGIFEQIFRISNQDICICFSFPRYSQRTIKAMEYASTEGAITIAITDNSNAPICKFSKLILPVKCDMVSVVDSLVAAMSLVNAILVVISVKKQSELKKTYDKLESIWDENNVYSSKDEKNKN